MNCIWRTIRFFFLSKSKMQHLLSTEREFPANYRFFLRWFYFFYNANTTAVERKKSRDVQLSINAFDIRQKPTFCAVAQFTQTRTRLYPEPIVSLAPPSPARLSTKFDIFSFLYRCIMCALAYIFYVSFFRSSFNPINCVSFFPCKPLNIPCIVHNNSIRC